MNAEQRRRYLRDRLDSLFRETRRELDSRFALVRINEDKVLSNDEKYNLIKNNKAKLHPKAELKDRSCGPYLYDAYVFEPLEKAKQHNQKLKELQENYLNNLNAEKTEIFDKIFLTKLDQAQQLLIDTQASLDQLLAQCEKELKTFKKTQ